MDKMIFVAKITKELLSKIGYADCQKDIDIYRSKGLLAHLLKRKHYAAAKYLDFIPEIITNPDFAGTADGQFEFVKIFKDNIFLSIKVDAAKNIFYVATMFDVKQSKIDSYCKSGRLRKISID